MNPIIPKFNGIKKLFLVNILFPDLSKKPLFITDDATFAVNFFNQWKRLNGKLDLLCQIEPMDLIESAKFEKTDIQTSTFGDLNDD